jgi:chemotaxis protein MotB
MAKRAKNKSQGKGIPLWLITYSDLMTLLLTFFVLLVAMSVIDERRRRIVLGSIMGTFGIRPQSHDPMARKVNPRLIEPGPLDPEDMEELEMLKPLLWEDIQPDLSFAENKFIQIFSIPTDVLFAPGETTISSEGAALLRRIVPVLERTEHPLLLAGHTSTVRDEIGMEYISSDMTDQRDPSWRISLFRVLSIYSFLLEEGLSPEKLHVEAFGKHHPRETNDTREGRRLNRRVDIVLDKRSRGTHPVLESLNPEAAPPERYEVDGFGFSLGIDREGR